MYSTTCLYISIIILLWVLSIYPFIKHYTIVILCKPYNLVTSSEDGPCMSIYCVVSYQLIAAPRVRSAGCVLAPFTLLLTPRNPLGNELVLHLRILLMVTFKSKITNVNVNHTI